jgi:hypothetical protein
MRTAIALVTAAVVTSASAQNANETRLGWIGGAGDTQCDKWLEAREKRGATVLNLGLEGWVLGFVSGGAIAFSNAFSNFTENDVFDRIDFYCREHRSDRTVSKSCTMIITEPNEFVWGAGRGHS